MRRLVPLVLLLACIGCDACDDEEQARGKESNVNQAPDEDSKFTDYGPEKGTRPKDPAAASANTLAKPTARQLEFMDHELGLFIHFGLNTFTGQEHGDGKEPPSRFNPAALDCEQWAKVAKSMGAAYVVLTARHEGGFCLWPTKTTDYCVRNSPWKNGKGDVVREFVDACRKHGLKPGLYHSSSFDAHHRNVLKLGDGEFQKMQVEQITELLTNYGPIEYLWFDHHRGDAFWKAIDDAVSRLQPRCLRFGPDVWISGGHQGVAGTPLWYAVNTTGGKINARPATVSGEPRGRFFRLWETNHAANGGWFWHNPKASAVAPLDRLLDKYYRSVGHGANFLLNFAPDRRGLMPGDVVARARELGGEIRRRFGKPVAQTRGTGDLVELDLGKPAEIDHVVAMEHLAGGQKIAEYRIEAFVDGEWRQIAAGDTVGHKRIDRVEPVTTRRLRFRCLKSVAGPVEIRSFAAYRIGRDQKQEP